MKNSKLTLTLKLKIYIKKSCDTTKKKILQYIKSTIFKNKQKKLSVRILILLFLTEKKSMKK